MSISSLSNSGIATKSVCLFNPSENFGGEKGVYLGKTATYKLPFFLDTDKLLNPHIVGVGMTGSGKTYFMKSYLIKFRFGIRGRVLILDWNGEYNELVAFLDGKITFIGEKEKPQIDMECDVLSLNLSGIGDDKKRVVLAREIVDQVIRYMHNVEIDDKQKRIFLIDEAWRALGKENNLGQLFREGRKYGFSIMVSTQLVSDINNEILSNAGAVFVFKLQNAEDQSILIDSGIISSSRRVALAQLSIGNCIVRLSYKEAGLMHPEITIRKIDGVSTSVYALKGGKMQIKVPNTDFSRITDEVIADQALKNRLVTYIEANGRSVDVGGLMKFLVKGGVTRANIITYFRALGFDDLTVVKSYESLKTIKVME